MLAKIRPRLSYANVMSTIAVFIAIGGSAVAAVHLSSNSVRSEQIANGQVKRADLANGAVDSAKVADHSLLATDFKAGQLKAGPQGPPGPQAAAGATSLKVRAASGTGEVTASCDPGERATGGGAHSWRGVIVADAPVSDPLAIYSDALPSSQGYTPTSWTAMARDAADGNAVPVTAWVVCAAP